VLLEFDWLDYAGGSDCGPVSHRPSAGAIARVTAMFANAPVTNPDGSTGIHVVHDYGQGGATSGGNLVTGYSAVLPDTFDAMSSTRTYRPALPLETVLAEIKRCAGTQFDPALANVFVTLDFEPYRKSVAEQTAPIAGAAPVPEVP
jgi:hypothetical protein